VGGGGDLRFLSLLKRLGALLRAALDSNAIRYTTSLLTHPGRLA
jgi:hypothetical protein